MTMIRIVLPIVAALLVAAILPWGREEAWAPATLLSPLGTDEFGRDMLLVALIATANSLLKGCLLTFAVLAVSIPLGMVIGVSGSSFFKSVLRWMTTTVESIPLVLWALVAVAAFAGSRPVIVMLVFMVAVIPIATAVISGEFERLRQELFIESSILLGVGPVTMLVRHYLPHAIGVLGPLAVQIVGAAITVDGALGVLGLGNRLETDLGTLLLRGKEWAFSHPELLMVGIGSVAVTFAYLEFLRSSLTRQTSRQAATSNLGG